MRNIIKKIKVQVVKVKYYDSNVKQEGETMAIISEINPEINLEKGCAVLEVQNVEEKELTYKMTAKDFIKNAIIVE